MGRRLIGYQTTDGKLYHPEDITLVYEAADDAALPPAEATTPAPAGPPTEKLSSSPAVETDRTTMPGPPDLHHAIQAATDALDHQPVVAATTGWRWWRPQDVARIAVEAAWETLTQPLADLQQSLDYVTDPSGWYTEQAAELDRLATFETAIRQAAKCNYDTYGMTQVDKALATLDQAREQTDG